MAKSDKLDKEFATSTTAWITRVEVEPDVGTKYIKRVCLYGWDDHCVLQLDLGVWGNGISDVKQIAEAFRKLAASFDEEPAGDRTNA